MNFNVKVRNIIENGSPLKAVCSVTLDDMYCVHGVKVVKTSSDRLIVTMPYETYTDNNGNVIRKDVFHPVSNEARKALEEAVFTAYEVAKALYEASNADA